MKYANDHANVKDFGHGNAEISATKYGFYKVMKCSRFIQSQGKVRGITIAQSIWRQSIKAKV